MLVSILLACFAGGHIRPIPFVLLCLVLVVAIVGIFVTRTAHPDPALAGALTCPTSCPISRWGFGIALTWQNIGLCLFGCVIGTAIEVLPGIGPLTTMAMILPVTFWLSPVGALIMLSGVFYGAQYGGSTTRHPRQDPRRQTSSVITVLDSHAMAQAGRAGPAARDRGARIAVRGIGGDAADRDRRPPLAKIALLFQSADYVSVMLLDLVSAVVLAHGSVLKAIGMIVLRCHAGPRRHRCVDAARYRMTMGLDVLFDGIGFVPLSIRACSDWPRSWSISSYSRRRRAAKMVSGLWPTRADLKRSFPPMVRGTVIGTAFGILPGGGPTIAAFSAYSLERRSRRRRAVQQGAIEGVAAPRSANNAAARRASFRCSASAFRPMR